MLSVHYAPRTPALRVDSVEHLATISWPANAALLVLGAAVPSRSSGLTSSCETRRPRRPPVRGCTKSFINATTLNLDLIVIVMPPDQPGWRTIRDRLIRAAERDRLKALHHSKSRGRANAVTVSGHEPLFRAGGPLARLPHGVPVGHPPSSGPAGRQAGGRSARLSTRQAGEDHELRLVLAEELARLPEKYRAPVLLCDMEGLTYDAAARQLGCPAGTVGVRLMRARDRLRGRLTRRGIGLPSVAIAAWVSSQKAHAVLPANLVAAVVEAASQRATVDATSIVAGLAERAMSGRFTLRATIAAGLLVAAGAAVTLALALASPSENTPTQATGAAGPGPQHAADQAAISGAVDFRVVDDDTKMPLEGVNLKVWVNGQPDGNLVTEQDRRLPGPAS